MIAQQSNRLGELDCERSRVLSDLEELIRIQDELRPKMFDEISLVRCIFHD